MRMPTRVGLESYEVMACHGAYDFEREEKQPYIISIWVTLSSDVENDDLEKTFNYAELQKAVDSEVVNSTPVKLMETLCKNLVIKISEYPIAEHISIRIEKPNAPLPHPGGLAIVEHEWSRT
tara:strand:+ start:222 stop:587 length:366 start_codon:yes stop_codon:yes gene_type:complete